MPAIVNNLGGLIKERTCVSLLGTHFLRNWNVVAFQLSLNSQHNLLGLIDSVRENILNVTERKLTNI